MPGTLIRRFPMKFDRVNLRSSLHLGASILLFDVYGAPKYSTGPYGAISLLGLDHDLGGPARTSANQCGPVRTVCDPMEIALPVPLLCQPPLDYEQFRFVIDVQLARETTRAGELGRRAHVCPPPALASPVLRATAGLGAGSDLAAGPYVALCSRQRGRHTNMRCLFVQPRHIFLNQDQNNSARRREVEGQDCGQREKA